jgi:hypothetical protein
MFIALGGDGDFLPFSQIIPIPSKYFKTSKSKLNGSAARNPASSSASSS